jgi:hypothetical protein
MNRKNGMESFFSLSLSLSEGKITNGKIRQMDNDDGRVELKSACV